MSGSAFRRLSFGLQPAELRSRVADVVAIVLLVSVGIVGFAATFEGARYLVAAIGALVLGLALAFVGLRWRWGILSLTGSTIAVYFLFGGALALPHTALLGVIPTIETWRQLAIGVVTSWKDLLTTVPPVASDGGHLIVPFLMTLVATVIAASLALRAKQAAWALLPLAVYLALEILLSTAQPAAPIVQGILFAVVAVVWLALRALWSPDRAMVEAAAGPGAAASRAARTRRLVSGGVVLALAAGVGVAASATASPPVQRYILRDFVIPPFDIQDYASPLQAWRKYIRDFETDDLFTVSGLPDDGRVRLAAMDAYDGVVYNVADDGAGSSSAFTSIRSNMSPEAEGDRTTVRVEVADLEGVWLPSVGAAKEIVFDGDRATDLRRGAHFNDATGTAVSTAELQPGDAYTIDTVIPVIPEDEQIGDAPFAPLKMPKQSGIPQSLSELASDATEDAETPIERARALEAWLQTDGYFSHGLADDVYSPSGHGAARISQLVAGEQMVGDDEQYAVTMALMATQLGMPARVVMGWYPDEEERTGSVFTATGDDLHAWVEIAFTGHGWIPFDPTPDEDNEPSEQNTKPRANPKPQVLQPPPPAQEPAELPPALAEDRGQDDDEEPGENWLGPILLYTGIGLGTIALLLSPFIVIGAIKAARRTKRRTADRTADRISGGWDELVDRATDYRVAVPAGATRAESAVVVAAAVEGERVGTLARRADQNVYGPGDPSPEDVEAFWREVDEIVGGLAGGSSFWQRLRARLSLRSFRRRAGLGKAGR